MTLNNARKLGATFIFILVVLLNSGVIKFMRWLGASDSFILMFYVCGYAWNNAVKFYKGNIFNGN